MAYKNDKTKNRRRYKSRYRSAHNYKQKRSSSQTKAAVLVSVLTFLVLASLVIVFTFGDSIYNVLDTALSQPTQVETTPTAATQAETQKPTTAPTEETTPPVEQNDDFVSLLEKCSLKEKDIKVSQMVFAVADESDNSCMLYCYEKNAQGVFEQKGDTLNGFIGQGGADKTTKPGDAVTPTGLFKIEYAFGTLPEPGTPLEYTQFTINDYWITDPASVNYNRWVYGTDDKDWNNAQWLYEYTKSYPYAVVFDYNRDPVDKSQGCAKFIHVSYVPTSGGGIGLSQEDILTLLYWLEPDKRPYIAICE